MMSFDGKNAMPIDAVTPNVGGAAGRGPSGSRRTFAPSSRQIRSATDERAREVRLREDDRELLAAVPRADVGVADRRAHERRAASRSTTSPDRVAVAGRSPS